MDCEKHQTDSRGRVAESEGEGPREPARAVQCVERLAVRAQGHQRRGAGGE